MNLRSKLFGRLTLGAAAVLTWLILGSGIARADELTLTPSATLLAVGSTATIGSSLTLDNLAIYGGGIVTFNSVTDNWLVTAGPDMGLTGTDVCMPPSVSSIPPSDTFSCGTFVLTNTGGAGTDVVQDTETVDFSVSGLFDPSPYTADTSVTFATPEASTLVLLLSGMLSLGLLAGIKRLLRVCQPARV